MIRRRTLSGSLISLFAMAIAVIAQPVVAQVSSADIAKSSQLHELKQRKALRVGFSTFVPWAMRSKTGELIGFEIDVAKQLGEDFGLDDRAGSHGMGRHHPVTAVRKD